MRRSLIGVAGMGVATAALKQAVAARGPSARPPGAGVAAVSPARAVSPRCRRMELSCAMGGSTAAPPGPGPPAAAGPGLMEGEDYESLPSGVALGTHMVAGAVAGILEHTVMYPVDSVKVRGDSGGGARGGHGRAGQYRGDTGGEAGGCCGERDNNRGVPGSSGGHPEGRVTAGVGVREGLGCGEGG